MRATRAGTGRVHDAQVTLQTFFPVGVLPLSYSPSLFLSCFCPFRSPLPLSLMQCAKRGWAVELRNRVRRSGPRDGRRKRATAGPSTVDEVWSRGRGLPSAILLTVLVSRQGSASARFGRRSCSHRFVDQCMMGAPSRPRLDDDAEFPAPRFQAPGRPGTSGGAIALDTVRTV